VDEVREPRGRDTTSVVIAHNGKCANRLLAPAGVPLVAGQMETPTAERPLVSMIAFAAPLPVPSAGGSAPRRAPA